MDLDIKRMLATHDHEPQRGPVPALFTPWGETLDAACPLGEHPRPQMERAAWLSLNGPWDYAIVDAGEDAGALWRKAEAPQAFDGQICVPFSPEAPLSGVGRQVLPHELLWYRRSVEAPGLEAGERLIWHLDAVDYACACYAGGACVGAHVGAYEPFAFDVTDCVVDGRLELALCVWDPSDAGTQLRGKQKLDRETMWYTAQSGIWQTTWLEVVPEAYIVSLSLEPDADAGVLRVTAEVSEPGFGLGINLRDGHCTYATGKLVGEDCACTLELALDGVRLWSPEDPYLYDLTFHYGRDEVKSYCAFRTVTVERDAKGISRVCLNHKPIYLRGLLNQAYWPDGLLTAPSEEARVFDIETCRRLGFNMFRLHIKIESERWYWLCDRAGMLVWQDMPSGGRAVSAWQSAQKPTLFRASWTRMDDTTERAWKELAADDPAYREEWLGTCCASVKRLSNHPCVIGWTLFNESWGQFSSAEACETVRMVDGTRPILATSGWYDQGAGDVWGVHNYFRGMKVYRDRLRPEGDRAFFISEFGGLSWHVDGHSTCENGYGYGSFETIEEWREGLAELLGEVDALWDKGLAGFVYTQVSDVEEETNGLLTYDRKVVKLD